MNIHQLSRVAVVVCVMVTNLASQASAAQLTVVPTPVWCGGVATAPAGTWQTPQATCDARYAELPFLASGGVTSLKYFEGAGFNPGTVGAGGCVRQPSGSPGNINDIFSQPLSAFFCPRGYSGLNSPGAPCSATVWGLARYDGTAPPVLCVRNTEPDFEKNITTATCDNCAKAGNPIMLGIGNKVQREVDYATALPGGLELVRVYNNRSQDAARNTGLTPGTSRFGTAWRGNYERWIEVYTAGGITTAKVFRPDGGALYFNLVGSDMVAEADVNERLLRQSDNAGAVTGWQYITLNDDTETYDASGKLLSITSRIGLNQAFIYSDETTPTAVAPAPGLLIRAMDWTGREVNFTYDTLWRVATMTDSANGVYQYAYSAQGSLLSVTYPDSKVRTYVYNESANTTGVNNPYALTGIVDENNSRFATFKYNISGQAISSEHAGGADKVTITFPGNQAIVTDAFNSTHTYTFQMILGVQKAASITGPACPSCGPTARTFDPNGNVTSRADWNGNRTCHAYDLTRNLETVRGEGLGATPCPATLSSWVPTANTAQRKTTTQWHSTFRLPTVGAEPLRKTTYIYNGDGGITCGFKADGTTLVPGVLCRKTVQATTDTNGGAGLAGLATGPPRVWSYTYNQNGSVLTMTGPAVQTAGGPVSPVTTYTYHANNATCPTTAPGSSAIGCRGQIASVSNALGQTTQIPNYNAHGQPLTVIDPNDLVTTMSYDPRMRLVSRNVGNETTTYTYDGVGQFIKVTMPDASYLEYQYDAAHRLQEIRLRDGSNAMIGKTTYTLDAMGNRTAEQIKDPGDVVLQARTRVYNNLNRLIRDIGGTTPGAQITSYGYDNQGNLQSVTAPAGAGGTRSYSYDALNRLVTQTDPSVAVNSAAGAGVTAYAYNGLDQLTAVTDPRSLITSYNYDGLNNLNQQLSPDTGNTANTYDAAGNILSSTDAKNQITSYTYDALARVASLTYQQASGNQLKTVAYQYDNSGGGNFGVGRLTQVTETGADSSTLQTTRYRYDQKGRLTEESRTLSAIAFVTGYGYDGAGRLTSMTYPTGRTVNYTLDGVGRIAAISTTKGGATQTVLNNAAYRPFGPITGFTFGNGQTYSRNYDLDGRTTSYSQATQNVSLGYDFASRITQLGANSYGYDEIDRLNSATAPGGTQAFAYDKVGNRVSKTAGAATDTYNFSPSSNRLTQILGASNKTYAYDTTGSVTSEGTNTFTYDARGRMAQATGTLGTSTYQVSSQGQRVRKSGAGGDTIYHYDAQGRLIAETGPTGTLQKEYMYLGDLPVAVIQ